VLATPIALLHPNADLFVGILIGIAVGLLAGPVLKAWLIYVEWTETSREARLTEALINRLDHDLDELPQTNEPAPDEQRTWRTSR
jgi:hypothetical protein